MEQDLSYPLDNRRTLWVTEISRATFDDQALDELGSDQGIFVVLEDASEGTFDVLAKVVSRWAGESLLNIVAQSMSKHPHLALVK